MAFGLLAAIRSETNIKTDFPTNQENDTLAHRTHGFKSNLDKESEKNHSLEKDCVQHFGGN